MNEKTREAELEIRKQIERLGYELSAISVQEYHDGEAVIELEVTLVAENESEYRVK